MDIQNLFQNIMPWLSSSGYQIFLILVIFLFFQLAGKRIIEEIVRKAIKHEDKESEEKRENTLIGLFNGVFKILIWLIAIMMILSEIGFNIAPILASAGILGVALGFGAQSMVRDFLDGFFIILENQYRIGDVITLEDVTGRVEEISLRKTVIRDLDGRVHHVPNGSFTRVSNLTGDYSRAHMDISVSYQEDIDKVMILINKVGKEMAEISPWKEKIIEPIQVMGTGPNNFAASGIEIKVLGKTKPTRQWDVLREFRRRIKIAFDEEGVEIPFPQMSVWPRGNWDK